MSGMEQQNEKREAHLSRVLTVPSLLAVVYCATIAGPYGLESSVSCGGPFYAVLLLLVFPFIWGLPCSLCVAELATSIPSNAGAVMWITVAFSQFASTFVMIVNFLFTIAENSMFPTIFGDYVRKLLHSDYHQLGVVIAKILFIWCTATINIIGIGFVGKVAFVITVITVAPIIVMCSIEFATEGINFEQLSFVPPTIHWGSLLPIVAWNYCGFEVIGNLAEEAKAPSKTIVRVAVLLVLTAILTYVPPILAGASTKKLHPSSFSHWTDGFWVTAGTAIGGPWLGKFVFLGSFSALLGSMTGSLAATSRNVAGMGQVGFFPTTWLSETLAKYDPNRKTPINAILLNASLCTLVTVFIKFQLVVDLNQLLYAIRLIAVLAAFLKMRLEHPGMLRPFSVSSSWLGVVYCGVLPLLVTLLLMVLTLSSNPNLWHSFICCTVAVTVLAVLRTLSKRDHKQDWQVETESTI